MAPHACTMLLLLLLPLPECCLQLAWRSTSKRGFVTSQPRRAGWNTGSPHIPSWRQQRVLSTQQPEETMALPPLRLKLRSPRTHPAPQFLQTFVLPRTFYPPGRDRSRALQPGDALRAKSGEDHRPLLLPLSQAQPACAHCPGRSSPSPQPGHPRCGGGKPGPPGTTTR